MERRLSLVVCLLLLAPTVLCSEQSGEQIPDTIFAWGDHLVFVALDRAVDPAGRIDPEVLSHPSRAEYLRSSLEATVGEKGCVEVNNFSSTDIPSEPTLRKALENMDHVLVGRVLDLRPGWQDRLGIAMLIQTDEVLVGAPAHRFFLFSPKGEFTFQDKSYCLEHKFFPDLPSIGDRVMFMYRNQSSGPMLRVESPGLITLPAKGSPSFGKAPSRRSAVSEVDPPELVQMDTSDEVITWVRQALREAGKL